jgi:hypothetical protein
MLEEVFTFRHKDDAMDFANELKRAGVKSRIESGCICYTDYQLMIPISIIRTLNQFDDPVDENMNERLKEILNTLKEDIERYFGEAKVGDLVEDPADRKQLISAALQYIAQNQESDSNSDELEKSEEELLKEKECKEAATYMNTVRILNESGMLKNEPGGWRVLKEIDHEKICLPVPMESLDSIESDIFDTIPKKLSAEAYAIPEWRVSTPPSFYISEVSEDIEDILDEYDMDENLLDDIISSIRTKELIIGSIFRFIKEKGVVSEDEIISGLTRQPVAINNREGVGIIAQTYYNPIVIEGIIQDLKKMNYIKGKPEKLRLA